MQAISEWESFYVIIGSSAAALTGLMFVVIALGAERNVGGSPALKAFATPTVVYFSSVLLLSAFLTMPHQSAVTLAVCIFTTSVAGMAYVATVIVHARRQSHYAPVLEDWIFHAVLPLVAFAILFAAGVLVLRFVHVGLYAVAATSLILLFTGIHNAWDSAVFMAGPDAAARRPPTSEG